MHVAAPWSSRSWVKGEKSTTNGYWLPRWQTATSQIATGRNLTPLPHWARAVVSPPRHKLVWLQKLAGTPSHHDHFKTRAKQDVSFHQGEPGSISGEVTLEFLHVGILRDDTTGRRVFLVISCFPLPFRSGDAPYSTRYTRIKTSMLRWQVAWRSTRSRSHSGRHRCQMPMCVDRLSPTTDATNILAPPVGFFSGSGCGTTQSRSCTLFTGFPERGMQQSCERVVPGKGRVEVVPYLPVGVDGRGPPALHVTSRVNNASVVRPVRSTRGKTRLGDAIFLPKRYSETKAKADLNCGSPLGGLDQHALLTTQSQANTAAFTSPHSKIPTTFGFVSYYERGRILVGGWGCSLSPGRSGLDSRH
ncbi:hypothetical protein PR048_015276 [Dryococelus australis]|uniref:Uncharacterized protein n=1 Tax=Dryococelus australis TaxID=614101 RepID=A0ABQ9HHH5_9NEOP|nr:hypothetical protein PR048_015276 [Dryococelus australis]